MIFIISILTTISNTSFTHIIIWIIQYGESHSSQLLCATVNSELTELLNNNIRIPITSKQIKPIRVKFKLKYQC